jgi:hypothetical protein
MKRHLELFWAHKKWVRKYLGGKWVRRIELGYEWVKWTAEEIKITGWPLSSEEYECEDYSRVLHLIS